MEKTEVKRNLNYKKKGKKENKGITLIALVVTIIVLLILAGISIQMLTGENGILKRAKQAREETDKAIVQEQRDLAQINAMMSEKNEEYIDKNRDKAVIPAGFALTGIEGESTVKEGLVITDGEGNEFVWVPVPKAIATSEDAITDVTQSGINFKEKSTPMAKEVTIEEKTETNYRGILYENWTVSEDGSGTVGVKSYGATTNGREPSVITGNGNEYDAVNTNLTAAGITENLDRIGSIDSKDLEYQMQKDYNEMVKSVEKYGGFYVARYEMSLSEDKKVQYQKDKKSYDSNKTENQWYEYYNKQREFVNNNYVKSSMIWGSQYDAMMNWMARCGIDVNSKTPSVGGTVTKRNTDTDRKTGTEEQDKLNNVYDLLGNSDEWTLEPDGTSYRVYRGGYYIDSYPPCYRYSNYPTNPGVSFCSRASLYIVGLDS